MADSLEFQIASLECKLDVLERRIQTAETTMAHILYACDIEDYVTIISNIKWYAEQVPAHSIHPYLLMIYVRYYSFSNT